VAEVKLAPERLATALGAIRSWRAAPEAPVACPMCAAEGLRITDCSARPYAEWYQLRCATCGLADTIHIPLAPPNHM
jgi:hypothetical protein